MRKVTPGILTAFSLITLMVISSCTMNIGEINAGASSGSTSSSGSSSSSGGSLYIFDDFNREDSATVGNGWAEWETNGCAASINGNRLILTGSNDNGYMASSEIYKNIVTISGNIRIKVKFSPDSASSFCLLCICNDSDKTAYYGRVFGTIFTIDSTESALLSGSSFPLTAGATYDLIFVKEGISLTLAITNTTNASDNCLISCNDDKHNSFNRVGIKGGYRDMSSTDAKSYIDDLTIKSF